MCLFLVGNAAFLSACETEAQRVSYNLSQEADNFNVVRQLTVINCLEGDTLFQMTGKMSIKADTMIISLKSSWKMKMAAIKSIL